MVLKLLMIWVAVEVAVVLFATFNFVYLKNVSKLMQTVFDYLKLNAQSDLYQTLFLTKKNRKLI